MVEVNWTAQAIEDVNSIAEFIAKDSKKYADAQVDEFFTSIQILEEFPLSGRIVPEINDKAIREIIMGSYRLVYEVINEKRVDILTVHHGARLLKHSPVTKLKKKTKRR